MRGAPSVVAALLLCAAVLADVPTTSNRSLIKKAPSVQSTSLTTQQLQNQAIASEALVDCTPAASASATVNPRAGHTRQGGEDCSDAFIITGLPFEDSGSTEGYVQNFIPTCAAWAVAPDVVYAFTPENDVVVNVSLCNGTVIDSVLYVLEDCGAEIACNDDRCGLQSEIKQLALSAEHTYYIVVTGYGTSAGPYTLQVVEWTPCVVECPPAATVDPEPECHDGFVDTWNGGCGAYPPVFQPITCDETICGSAGTYVHQGNSYRDTDWFEITVDTETQFTFTVEAEFTVVFGLAAQIEEGVPGCDNVLPWLFPSVTAGECTPMSVTTDCLSPGTYYFVVTTNDFSGVPCGGRYTATLTCTPCVIPRGACCLPSGECVPEVRESRCSYLVGQWYGDGTTCETVDCPDCRVEAALTASVAQTVVYHSNTAGAGDDCLWRPSEEEMIEITIPADGTWRFEACGLEWDAYLMLFEDCCYGLIAEYGLVGCATLEVSLNAGTYYLAIEGSNEAGLYELAIDYCPPGACCLPTGACIDDQIEGQCMAMFGQWAGAYLPCTPNLCAPCAVCPPEGASSPEPACHDEFMDMWNGGCNYIPNTFEPITCGQTICGDAGTFLFTMQWGPMSLRDMDWYELVLEESAVVNVTAVAEFPMLIGQVQQIVLGVPGCDNITTLFEVSARAEPCQQVEIQTGQLPPGTYYFSVSPSQFEGVACGSQYYLTLDCTPVVIPTGACCISDGSCIPDLMEYECLLENGYWQGGGIECDPNPCQPCGACPAGGAAEAEPACYDEFVDIWNGGCNSYPPVFEPLLSGRPVCGTSGNYIFTDPWVGPTDYRDTDWFEITVDTASAFQLDVAADFPVIFGLVEQIVPGIPGCENHTGSVKPFVVTPTCVPATLVTDCLPAGTYYFWVSTANWSGTPCGAPYTLTVTAQPCAIPRGACCLLDGMCVAERTEAECLNEFGYWQGAGVDCAAAECAVLHQVNDGCAEAACMPEGTAWGSNLYASGRDSSSCALDDWADVWWRYSPTADGEVTIDTFGSDFDTTLAVYEYPCDGAELACNNDAPGVVQSQLVLPMLAGRAYLIRVAGHGGDQGDIVLNVTGGAGVCAATGDVNCDGQLNVFDIDPFVLALTDPAGYATAFPACSQVLADVNGDGMVNVFDIDPFVLCLTGGGCSSR